MTISGLLNQPKWGHLNELHKAIKLCEPALLSVDPIVTWPGKNLEVKIISTSFMRIPNTKGFCIVNLLAYFC